MKFFIKLKDMLVDFTLKTFAAYYFSKCVFCLFGDSPVSWILTGLIFTFYWFCLDRIMEKHWESRFH